MSGWLAAKSADLRRGAGREGSQRRRPVGRRENADAHACAKVQVDGSSLSPFAIEAFEKPASAGQLPRNGGRCHVGIPSNGSGKIPCVPPTWQAFSIAGPSAIV